MTARFVWVRTIKQRTKGLRRGFSWGGWHVLHAVVAIRISDHVDVVDVGISCSGLSSLLDGNARSVLRRIELWKRVVRRIKGCKGTFYLNPLYVIRERLIWSEGVKWKEGGEGEYEDVY